LDLLGVINPSHVQYYPKGDFSFTLSTTTGQKTAHDSFCSVSDSKISFKSSVSFPRPNLKQTFEGGVSTLYFYESITSSFTPYNGYDKTMTVIDAEKNFFYTKNIGSGRHFSTPPNSTSFYNLSYVQKVIGNLKTIDICIHDGIYYGMGTEADLNNPGSIVIDTLGNLFVADSGNGLIRRFGADGSVKNIGKEKINYLIITLNLFNYEKMFYQVVLLNLLLLTPSG